MKKLLWPVWACLLGGSWAWPARSAEPAPAQFALNDGDRVVLIGGTLIERAQVYGYLETLLTAQYPDRSLQFRNLGWSGDTVFGEARAVFGTAADGFKRLKEQVLTSQPTWIIVGYGGNEAFEGAPGLDRFRQGLNQLDAEILRPTKAKVLLLLPPRQENAGPPLPDPAKHNSDLQLYRDVLVQFASRRNDISIDLYDLLSRSASPRLPVSLTDDSLHFSDYGYWTEAHVVARALGLNPLRWRVVIGPDLQIEQARGTKISKLERFPDGLRFDARDAMLPGLPIAAHAPEGAVASWGPMPILEVKGLPLGRYAVRIDGKVRGVASAQALASGIPLLEGPGYDQVEQLRQAIIKKNRLFFHRWRPQNETYLFGFRKHEQGQNAREIPEFDPLVGDQEKEIARLRVPTSHTYEVVREAGVKP